MPSITIHAITPELDLRLSQEAKKRRYSKNALVKELLSQALGLPVDGQYADDYRQFCGRWTVEEKAAFDAAQAGNSQVDPADWT